VLYGKCKQYGREVTGLLRPDARVMVG